MNREALEALTRQFESDLAPSSYQDIAGTNAKPVNCGVTP